MYAQAKKVEAIHLIRSFKIDCDVIFSQHASSSQQPAAGLGGHRRTDACLLGALQVGCLPITCFALLSLLLACTYYYYC